MKFRANAALVCINGPSSRQPLHIGSPCHCCVLRENEEPVSGAATWRCSPVAARPARYAGSCAADWDATSSPSSTRRQPKCVVAQNVHSCLHHTIGSALLHLHRAVLVTTFGLSHMEWSHRSLRSLSFPHLFRCNKRRWWDTERSRQAQGGGAITRSRPPLPVRRACSHVCGKGCGGEIQARALFIS